MIKTIFNAENRAVRSFRIYSYVYNNVSKFFGYFLYQRAKLKYNFDIAPTAIIGKDFKIVHLGSIVVGRNAQIGSNCTINNNVTLGMKNQKDESMPVIGDNVYISTGAKLLGNIKIGNNCIIGANSVVNKSFEDSSIIAGIPAKKISQK
ncbi:serine O-acetyltransferase [Francisella frigiditurris]|uniref:Bacterial transferase hexapeptide family protein n=1 Tax=Francisella frigiditurris TaxID=1542390 RepID=A0A1J0KVG2_9GAMM|nr:hypothetical protein [Francisella frigiditurris]APC97808.1 bacterial transferase hexapeptide family protein [Francisella frigiditurris]